MKTIIVSTEQGIGDEIMGCTMLPDVIKDYDVILDCHPRLEWLHQHSVYGDKITIVPTRKERGEPATRPIGIEAKDVYAKVALLDLCRIYRRSREDFKWEGPVFFAPEAEAAQMREHLVALADGRRIVGLATRGGTPSTATRVRRLNQAALEALFERDDCFYVGLDYEDMTQLASWAQDKYPDRYYWPAAVNFSWDYFHVAALIEACDEVITVPQSVMHLSCGMGKRTHILVPSKPDWRLGVAGGFCWYPGDHVQIYRQKQGEDWMPIIRKCLATFDARMREVA